MPDPFSEMLLLDKGLSGLEAVPGFIICVEKETVTFSLSYVTCFL